MSVGLLVYYFVHGFACSFVFLLVGWSVGLLVHFFLSVCYLVCLYTLLNMNSFDDTFHHLDRNPNVQIFAINPVQKTSMDWHLCESRQQNMHQFRLIWQLDRCIQNGVQLDQDLWFDLIEAHTFSNWIQHICKWEGELSNRYLLRFFDCLAHPNVSSTYATDQKWPLCQLRISYQSLAGSLSSLQKSEFLKLIISFFHYFWCQNWDQWHKMSGKNNSYIFCLLRNVLGRKN